MNLTFHKTKNEKTKLLALASFDDKKLRKNGPGAARTKTPAPSRFIELTLF